MYRLRLILVIALVFYGLPSKAKVCENVHVVNTIEFFKEVLRDCTVVVGYLKIVLMEYDRIYDHHNLTFPDLKEITGYLLLYRLPGLTSVGKLFPNLTVIRGDVLVAGYSLIIYDIPDLKEIGLKNLRYIGKGSTRIEKCPQLCFVDTVNWSRIGPRRGLHYFNANQGDCESCPGHCNGTCWNENHCQIGTEQCHPECIGCTGPGPDECHACKSYSDNGKCVSQCPKEKFRHSKSFTCVTEVECVFSLKGTWWTFQGECISKCPGGYELDIKAEGRCVACVDYCKKICEGGTIHDAQSASFFYNCTHVLGPLEITVRDEDAAREVTQALARVEEIQDYLVIYRSSPLGSLAFMKNLKVISGKQLYKNRYALVVIQNHNLHELWKWDNFTLTVKNGSIYFHYNPQLCLSTIKKLLSVIGISQYSQMDVSFDSNGFGVACNYIDLNVVVTKLTSTNSTLTWEKHVNALGYTLYYTEDPFTNKTVYDGNNECFDEGWFSIFVRGNTALLADLNPYTQYAFYVQVYTSSSFNWGRTAIHYFTTHTTEPSQPQNIKVDSISSSSITVTWEPPERPGGILSYYILSIYLQEESTHFILQRDYCLFPLAPSHLNEETPLETWDNSTCCNKQNWTEWNEEPRVKRSYITDSAINEIVVHIPSNLTTYELTSLQNFKIYILLLRACNDNLMCSGGEMFFQRTMPKQGVDDMPPGIAAGVHEYGVHITWSEPVKPNSVITSYILEYRRTDLEDSLPTLICVTTEDYRRNDHGYIIVYPPGQYSVKVTAISLAGPGKSSDAATFEIKEPTNFTPVYIAVAIIIFIFIASGVVYRYWNKTSTWLMFTNSSSIESLRLHEQYVFERHEVDVSSETTQDMFGTICNGFIKSQNRPCTIKFGQEHEDSSGLSDYFKDTSILHFSNECYHIVTLLGFVLQGRPSLIITELMARGDLKSFLRHSKDGHIITQTQIYRMAAEIADGMIYLASKKFVHCDLAARNCMVSAGNTVKIVNFGIAKDIYDSDYYKDQSKGLIPVRWMAPESLADGECTTSSNVWSYGIVLWELATLAKQPYQDLFNEEVLQYVIGQNIMDCPLACPDLLYEMMVACWKWRPADRPHFTGLLKQLQSHVQRDFKLVSFYHSREGMKYRKSLKNKEYSIPVSTDQLEKNVRWNALDEGVVFPILDDQETHNVPSTSGHI